MGRFIELSCPYCKATLPALPHYKNSGLICVYCSRCKKICYIRNLKALKS